MNQPRRRSPAAQRKKTRMVLLVSGVLFLAAATALTLTALEENVTFFFGPTEVFEKRVPAGARFRIGGLVETGSVERLADGATTQFSLTDGANSVTVAYTDLLPDLFREGQGIVALGRLDGDGVFIAEEVLAKHDETYMPPEAVEAMKRAGTWRHGEDSAEGTQQ